MRRCQMIREAERKARACRLRASQPVSVGGHWSGWALELAGEKFDGVYSNFGAINCAPDLVDAGA